VQGQSVVLDHTRVDTRVVESQWRQPQRLRKINVSCVVFFGKTTDHRKKNNSPLAQLRHLSPVEFVSKAG